MAWYLIVRDIYDSMYSEPRVRSQQTLDRLTEVNPLEPNWIKRDVETGKWTVGQKFYQLIDDTDPVNSWAIIEKAVLEAIEDLVAIDSTGWFMEVYRDINSESRKNPLSWIRRIVAGLCHDRTVSKLATREFRTEVQINSVINEFLYVIDTIQKYVGPTIISPSWKFRPQPNLAANPNIDRAFNQSASWFKILEDNEGHYLCDVINSLLLNNFRLNKNTFYEIAALIMFNQDSEQF